VSYPTPGWRVSFGSFQFDLAADRVEGGRACRYCARPGRAALLMFAGRWSRLTILEWAWGDAP
jgi:hypothetical protein